MARKRSTCKITLESSASVEEPLLRWRTHQAAHKNLCMTLLRAWQENAYLTFDSKLVASVLNYTYPGYSNLRLIDLIVSEKPHKVEFLDRILSEMESSACINEPNLKTGNTAAQYAVVIGNYDAFWRLVAAKADVNLQDKDGDTMLHNIIETYASDPENLFTFLKKLLMEPTIAINIPNLKGITPIAQAALSGLPKIVSEFLKLGPANDLDTFRCREANRSARDILRDLKISRSRLPERWQPVPDLGISNYRYRLFYFLTTFGVYSHKHEKIFLKLLRQAVKNSTIEKQELFHCVDQTGFTLLQRAAQMSKMSAVSLIIELGADINYAPPDTEPAIFYAALLDDLTVFSALLFNENLQRSANAKGETLLHTLVKNRGSRCLNSEALAQVLRLGSIDVNQQDELGQTALHWAVTKSNKRSIFELLDHGASLDSRNQVGNTPFDHLSAEIFENYLDSKVTANDKVPQDLEYTVIVDYKFWSNKSTNHIHEIKTAHLKRLLKSKQHQKLLAHPVIAAIIAYKWNRIRQLYYFYLICSSLFSVFFTTYIYNIQQVSSTDSSSLILCIGLTKWFSLLYLTMRCINEIIDMYNDRWEYVWSVENWLQISMIVVATSCIIMDSEYGKWDLSREVSASAVLLVWFDMFFIVGKPPRVNFKIDMFRKAFLCLFSFLLVHLPLILGFIFCFNLIFKDGDGPFATVAETSFKILVMMTGEYDVSDIKFESVLSRLVFVLFIFLAPIVLFNLLIGLAVSATRPIEEDTFLYSCIAQVSVLAYIEKIFLSKPLQPVIKYFDKKENKRPDVPSHCMLFFYPNQKTQEIRKILEDTFSTDLSYKQWIIYKDDLTVHEGNVLNKRIVSDVLKIVSDAEKQHSEL